MLNLKYDNQTLSINADLSPDRFLTAQMPQAPDDTFGLLNNALAKAYFDKWLKEFKDIALIVPDHTRKLGNPNWVPSVCEHLTDKQVKIIMACGLHRSPTEEEKRTILSDKVFDSFDHYVHDGYNQAMLTQVGSTSFGNQVYYNKRVVEAEAVILLSTIRFHYFAGFGGGRKGFVPGVAGEQTINYNHKLTFDMTGRARNIKVRPGNLQGNPVHEDMVEAVKLLNKPIFHIGVMLDASGKPIEYACGDIFTSHEYLANKLISISKVPVRSESDLTIVSSGGFPYDTDFVQAHKAMEMATFTVKPGGTIILFASCKNGWGTPTFFDHFLIGDSDAMLNALVKDYTINCQTAWSGRHAAEHFQVYFYTELPDEQVKTAGMKPFKNLAQAEELINSAQSVYVMPNGASVLPVN